MDFEPFRPDDLVCLWIGNLMDGCPAINCAVAQENLSDEFNNRALTRAWRVNLSLGFPTK